MSYTTLHNFKQLAKAYSGNENPGVFILSDTTDDSSKAFEPTCVFVDDNGDLIVQVDKKNSNLKNIRPLNLNSER